MDKSRHSFMMISDMNFDAEILKVLTMAGNSGLKTEKVARHVFNACNSMFVPLNYKDVHAYVTQYLIKNSKDPQSIIEKSEKHGVYRLNFNSKQTQQLLLNFLPHESVEERKNDQIDNGDYNCFSPNLFE